jgi:hypothetical protein
MKSENAVGGSSKAGLVFGLTGTMELVGVAVGSTAGLAAHSTLATTAWIQSGACLKNQNALMFRVRATFEIPPIR